MALPDVGTAPVGFLPEAALHAVPSRPDDDGAEGLVERLARLSPGALKGMDLDQVATVASDIRSFLVAAVADNGGHLGSNLGAVELTLALHRVFASPVDRLVWDTGHQIYAHKVVTGRAADFVGLRRVGGLSGYANRAESAHDLVENSHASTALSYAFGLARARDVQRQAHQVVAVVGDGALTGGLAYEALANIGMHRTRLVIVLNDNGRSYAPTVSRLTTADATGVSDDVTSPGDPAAFFGALGVAYTGPVDGHDQAALETALRDVAGAAGPVVLHVHTEKGRGYGPAERDDEKRLHDVGPFHVATGAPRRAVNPPTYTAAFGEALLREAAVHPELVAITAAMPGSCGLLEFARRYPARFLDVGIAEQHAVTTAAGLAMGGLRPVVAIYSTFLNRAWDQLYYDVGLHGLPVIFCIDRAGVTGDDGPSHNGVLDLALLTKVPGMTVLAPSSYEEVPVMLADALAITSGPVAIRWPKTEARRSITTGSGVAARRLRAGHDVCFLALGKMVAACEDAAGVLAAAGVEATVWDMRAARPLDPAMLRDALAHRAVLTVEDGVAEGGAGASAVTALRTAAGDAALPAVEVCGVPLAYLAQGNPDRILAELGLDGAHLAARALALLPDGPSA
jgi:1-deoxy-D-xylulose-5-phosphate synthase